MSTTLFVRSRETGPVFFADREYGEWIASAVGSLDQIAESLNLQTIDSFSYMDPEILQEMIEMVSEEKAVKMARRLREQKEWHSPAEGLKTIAALKAAVMDNSTQIEFRKGTHGPDLRAALIEDLQAVSLILSDLVKSGDSFHFEAG